jgi:hypothetical protein
VSTTAPEAEAAGTGEDSQTAAAATEKPVEGAAETPKAAEPVATTAPEAEAAGTSEDSQTAAAATEKPVEG